MQGLRSPLLVYPQLCWAQGRGGERGSGERRRKSRGQRGAAGRGKESPREGAGTLAELLVLRNRALQSRGVRIWPLGHTGQAQKHSPPRACWGRTPSKARSPGFRLFLCLEPLGKLLPSLGCSLLVCSVEVGPSDVSPFCREAGSRGLREVA